MIRDAAFTSCPRCDASIAPDVPHCPICGRPRILESLLTPRVPPVWHAYVWNGVALMGVVFFLVTAGVAFLREAKAVRVARQALAQSEPAFTQRARQILSPFLVSYPEHGEAHFLAALAAVRLEDLAPAAGHRARVAELKPDRLAELDVEVEKAIDAAILGRGCSADRVLSYHDDAVVLGDDFRQRVVSNVQAAVRRCQRTQHENAAYALVVGMVERGAGETLVQETYLEPLHAAIAGGRFEEAMSLALGASRVSMDTQVAVDEQLAGVRGSVETSLGRLEEVCDIVRNAPQNRIGRFWCFPERAPAVVAGARDGWGRAFRYKPLALDANLQCYQGFELVSYGADGRETLERRGYPDDDFVCRFLAGRLEHQVPGGFWRSPI